MVVWVARSSTLPSPSHLPFFPFCPPPAPRTHIKAVMGVLAIDTFDEMPKSHDLIRHPEDGVTDFLVRAGSYLGEALDVQRKKKALRELSLVTQDFEATVDDIGKCAMKLLHEVMVFSHCMRAFESDSSLAEFLPLDDWDSATLPAEDDDGDKQGEGAQEEVKGEGGGGAPAAADGLSAGGGPWTTDATVDSRSHVSPEPQPHRPARQNPQPQPPRPQPHRPVAFAQRAALPRRLVAVGNVHCGPALVRRRPHRREPINN